MISLLECFGLQKLSKLSHILQHEVVHEGWNLLLLCATFVCSESIHVFGYTRDSYLIGFTCLGHEWYLHHE
jgi:hypothetical protein